MDPRIGILCCEGKQVFYAFVDGYHKPEFRGTLDQVEVALGIRTAPVARPVAKPIKTLRTYVARLTSPGGEVSEYETEAVNKTEARTKIRRLFRIDVPSPKNGFYSFEEHTFTWIEDDED